MPRPNKTKSHLRDLPRRLAADQAGVTAIVTGIALTVILGFAGLAIDVAAWLNATRGMQAAADQAAYSAAYAAGTNGCSSQSAYTQARAVAALRGYVNEVNNTDVETSCNSSNSNFTVRISQTQPMWFAQLFLSSAPRASASATAQLAGKVSDLCVLALDGTNVAEGVTGSDVGAAWLNGNTTVNLHCGLAVDSSNLSALSVGGSSQLSATDIYLVGDDQGSPSGSATLTTSPTANNILRNQNAVEDPYAGRIIPPLSGCDQTNFSVTNTGQNTISPGVYCGGMSLGGTGGGHGNPVKITLNAGTYYIVGGQLNINANADVNGTGVTFVLTGGTSSAPLLGQTSYATVSINGSALVTLTAPTSGATGGMAFFADRNAPYSGGSSSSSSCGSGNTQNMLNGGSGQLITGALYFPSESICYSGSSAVTGAGQCTQLIARTISFTGNSDVKLSCAGTGVSAITILVPQLIK